MTEPAATAERFDPTLLAVLSSRMTAILREMTNIVVRTSRSSVIKTSRDFSCGIVTYDHRQISCESGLPVHLAALSLTTRPISEFFDDVKEGDAYVNNCSYTGGTHHADIALCVPVFCDAEPLFWTVVRAHHADIGAPEPTTYLPYARTIYEEGLHFPCVRFQEHYEDKADLIRLCRMQIRVADVWYGDYRAQVGACRTAERRLKELVAKYGLATVKAFIEAWIAYGERRMIAAIRALPAGTWSYETRHDPVPTVADEGVPVRATLTVDPEAARITVDVRDNMDCVPGGINQSETCATAGCLIGVYNNLDPTIPHNEGSASRVEILLRDGCVVGRPTYAVGTSVATTNVNDRLSTAVSGCFTQMGRPHGRAEAGYSQTSGLAVISGLDPRSGRPEPYINQFMLGLSGGAGVDGHDGWVTHGAPCDGGMLRIDPIETVESMYPVLIEERRLSPDTLGSGEWDGAPATQGSYRPLGHDVTVNYASDGDTFASKGALGGAAGAPAVNAKRHADGTVHTLPSFHEEVCGPDEAICYRSNAGGGYGDPRQRDPARVAATVNRGWLSPERAKTVYAVALVRAANGVDFEVDEAATAALRSQPA